MKEFYVPEFEQKADSFIVLVKEIGAGEKFTENTLSLIVEKSLPNLIEGYDSLQIVINEADFDLPVKPREISDELDVKSATCCVVCVEATMDNAGVIGNFIYLVLSASSQFGGMISSNLPGGTQDESGYIIKSHDPANGNLFTTRLYFEFS